MKKQLLFVFFILVSMSSFSQDFKVFMHSGYTFSDKFPIYGGSGKIYDGHTYGGSLSYTLSPVYELELSYSRQDSRIIVYSPGYVDINSMASTNYFFIGTNRIVPVSESFEVFGGAKIGGVTYASKGNGFSNVTKFAAGISAGMSYFFNPNLGLRVQANLNFPVIDVGANLWWSSGSGVNTGVSAYSPILQFGFTGGLVFKLSPQK